MIGAKLFDSKLSFSCHRDVMRYAGLPTCNEQFRRGAGDGQAVRFGVTARRTAMLRQSGGLVRQPGRVRRGDCPASTGLERTGRRHVEAGRNPGRSRTEHARCAASSRPRHPASASACIGDAAAETEVHDGTCRMRDPRYQHAPGRAPTRIKAIPPISDARCHRTMWGSGFSRAAAGGSTAWRLPGSARHARTSADGSSAAKRSASVGRDRAGQIALSSKFGSAPPSRTGL